MQTKPSMALMGADGDEEDLTLTVLDDPKHPLVVLADMLDWTDLIEVAQGIRRKKLKNLAGRPPHLRALIGAVILMALRNLTYREAEDQIRHYGPARYLCGGRGRKSLSEQWPRLSKECRARLER